MSIDKTEPGPELPNGWCWATVGDTGRYINGFAFKPEHREATGRPIVRIQNLTDPEKSLNRTSLAVSDDFCVETGGMLVSWSATVDVFVWNREPALVNQHIFKVVPYENLVDRTFLFYWLKVAIDQLLDSEHLHGSTMKHINRGPFMAHRIPLPPLPEQQRLAEKLEELLSDLDAGVAELKAAQRKLAQYRQSLLKAAVDGTLTADWRAAHGAPQETGAELLQRILTERRARWEQKQLAKYAEKGKTPPNNWQAKYPEPVVPTLTDLPPLPAGWAWATVDQLASVGTGVTPLRSNRAYFENGEVPWTTSGALNEEVITAPSEHVTNLAVSECRLDLYPIGTLLVAMYGEGKTRGKCAELAFPSTINQAIAAIVFQGYATAVAPHVKTFFLDAYEAMRKQASGGVQPNLNLQIIKALCIPLPPLSEQVEVQVRLDEQLASYRRLKDSTSAAIAQSVAQRKNLLKAAFAGQLVPQDPNDEPASALLARIRAKHCEEVRERPSTSRARKAR